MPALTVVAADTDAEARLLATSLYQAFVNLRTGRAGPLPPPVEGFFERLEPGARAMLDHALACAVIGGPETVRRGLQAFAARTGADEVMITSQIFDHAARRRSFEIVAEAWGARPGVMGSAAPASDVGSGILERLPDWAEV
jgi:alkanesulfonate monooxygenase SsuD/methylene tetrahydromethanopterin reductase-like flavin-dependent oxidoreductase (luciferase family)